MSILREQLTAGFEKIYRQLNEQQRRAVDHLEGPVMVIAGPGTGKTQLLAARIGRILQETDALPENILCLTYTDAGAVAMRQRLQSFIGAEAYRVNIHTFHAFCNDIIQDNRTLFEKNSLEPVSELERIELIKTIVDGLDKDNPLKRYRGDAYFEISNLKNLYSDMKREGWDAAFIKTGIREYLEDLPNREAFIYKTSRAGKYNKGDLKQEAIENEKDKMARTAAAADTFVIYQELLHRHNRYDFEDMINWVLTAFREHPYLLAQCREQYQYILVDEYQDTSGSQNALVSALLGDDPTPNIFVVGDDDQSIYRFQGANVVNMLNFAQAYAPVLYTIVLTENYRSVQPVLDVSRALIGHNEERLVNKLPGLEKVLKAAHPDRMHDLTVPRLCIYANPFQEMAGLAGELESLIREQGVPPEHIAVIYRENKYGEALSRFLQMKDIPVYAKRKQDLFKEPLAVKLLTLLRYIAAETEVPYSGDGLLFEILHYDLYGVPPVEVARLSVEVAEKSFREKTSLRAYLQDWLKTRNPTLFEQRPHEALFEVARKLEGWIGAAFNTTLQELTERVIREGGFLPHVLQSPDKVWLMQVLSAVFDFVKAETRRNPELNIGGLVRTLDLMERNGLPVAINRILGNEHGVNLLTAHGAKGLEFEYVFLAGGNATNWEKKRKPSSGYTLPDTLLETPAKYQEEEELRRLFFVAVTRARRHLSISWCRENNEGKALEPSRFIAELREGSDLPEETVTPDSNRLADFAALEFTAAAPRISAEGQEWIDRLLDKFVMNVTALNNYLDCPLKFYYNNLLRVPSGRSEATEFGSAVHHALERLFLKMQESEDRSFPAEEVLLNDFRWFMHHHRESFTREAYARRMEYGQDILRHYYQQYAAGWNKVVSIELNVRHVVVDGIPLKGKLDKLEFNGNAVNVVDYKTGNYERKGTREKLLPPNEKNPLGGDYWRQAVFYKLLLDHYKLKDWRVASTEFDFIEPNKKKEYYKHRIDITAEDTATVLSQVKTVWQQIRQREFYTGCGKPDCHWCHFTSTHHQQLETEDAETE
ncbi:ATP-dependent DNA helicase [Compostibacter hankyongensis]|uniref:DNA 3'-5' helicase n=1 Tax=Compostibacter hankyongensis TaxID=1007089 RepID=A0ABP8G4V9_9BACT